MKEMKIEPIFENVFYHDGRGPELKDVVWRHNGVVLGGFEYFNPDDVYEEANLKNIELVGVQAYSMASDELHRNISQMVKATQLSLPVPVVVVRSLHEDYR